MNNTHIVLVNPFMDQIRSDCIFTIFALWADKENLLDNMEIIPNETKSLCVVSFLLPLEFSTHLRVPSRFIFHIFL